MKTFTLLLCLVLAGCLAVSHVFDPVAVEQRRIEDVLVLEDGTVVPVAYNFPVDIYRVCGKGIEACAQYHVFPDGKLDYSQRCEMYFNAARYNPFIKAHEEDHCVLGEYHPHLL